MKDQKLVCNTNLDPSSLTLRNNVHIGNVQDFLFLLELVIQMEDLTSTFHRAIRSGMPIALWLIWVVYVELCVTCTCSKNRDIWHEADMLCERIHRCSKFVSAPSSIQRKVSHLVTPPFKDRGFHRKSSSKIAWAVLTPCQLKPDEAGFENLWGKTFGRAPSGMSLHSHAPQSIWSSYAFLFLFVESSLEHRHQHTC